MAKAGRASRPRLRLLPTILLTIAIIGLPTVVYAWGRNSSSFEVQRVAVTGTDLVPRRRALRLLRREFTGRNLFTVTTADVRKALSSQPYVADVSVDRDFPSTLRVDISEYEPVAYALSGGRWYVLAGDAYVICEVGGAKGGVSSASDSADEDVDGEEAGDASASPAPSSSPTAGASVEPSASPSASTAAETSSSADADDSSAGLGRLTAGPADAPFRLPRLAVSGARVGSRLARPRVTGALGVIDALPAALRKDLAVVETSSDGVVTLRFADGPVVTWGDATERVKAKTIALRMVLARYEDAGKACTFMDVSLPDRVLARPVLK